jgi:hypothetical protein
MTVKPHYITTDFVNAATAEKLGLEVAETRDLPRLEREGAAVALDWDHLPHDCRTYLLDAESIRVVGVHGYDLSEPLTALLPLCGVRVSRYLDLAFVAGLPGKGRAA